MRVIVSVNGQEVENIVIVNRGPVTETAATGYDPDGWRRYEWSCDDIGGEVLHARVNGAAQLAAACLMACDDRRRRQ